MNSFITLVWFLPLLMLDAATLDSPADPMASFKNDLARRQLSFGCGLSFTAWGTVSPVAASGYANLCLQCRVNVLGVVLSFGFYDTLSQSVSAHGVSASNAAILQSSIQSNLNTIAARATTKAQCTASFATDTRCGSYTFANGQCTATAVNYVTNNKSPALAQAFQSLYQSGGGKYCSICPSDRSCASASAIARRSVEQVKGTKGSRCPPGLTACPITPTSSLTPSDAYECLDVSEEINSCGGCVTLGEGTDCAALRGVRSSGCLKGQCNIFSCAKGYRLSAASNKCIKNSHAHQSKARSH